MSIDNATVAAKKLADFDIWLAEMISSLEKTGDLHGMLRLFKSVRDAHDTVDAVRKKLFSRIEFLSREAIPTKMAEDGVTTITLDGFRYSIGTRSSTSIVDKEAAYAWLRAYGHEAIIQQTVNSSTMASFARKYLEDTGYDLPEFFKTSTMKYTSVTPT